jgi:N-acetyl-gamma-glutamylphosphate reductase
MQRTEIINPSLHVFCYELQEHIQNGFEIDPDNTPVTWGVAYQVGLIKRDEAQETAVLSAFTGAYATTTELHVKPLLQEKRSVGRPKQVK